MKVRDVELADGPVEQQTEIETIEAEDLPPPSEEFQRFVRSLKAHRFLNALTLDTFAEQVHDHYVSQQAPTDEG